MNCHKSPIKGYVYQCQHRDCPAFHLCHSCYNSPDLRNHRSLHKIVKIKGTKHEQTGKEQGIAQRDREESELEKVYQVCMSRLNADLKPNCVSALKLMYVSLTRRFAPISSLQELPIS